MPAPKPTEPITGGCLCGEVRYSIDFSADDAKWPPARGGCQCTMCRKNMSCLIPQAIIPKRHHIALPAKQTSHYKTYMSSENVKRTFCDICGSTITCEELKLHPDDVEIWVGTVDEKWLIGEKVESSAKKTERGTEYERKGGYPQELCVTDSNIWMENAIPGMTDKMPGTNYLTDTNSPGYTA